MTSVRILTDSILYRENKRAWARSFSGRECTVSRWTSCSGPRCSFSPSSRFGSQHADGQAGSHSSAHTRGCRTPRRIASRARSSRTAVLVAAGRFWPSTSATACCGNRPCRRCIGARTRNLAAPHTLYYRERCNQLTAACFFFLRTATSSVCATGFISRRCRPSSWPDDLCDNPLCNACNVHC